MAKGAGGGTGGGGGIKAIFGTEFDDILKGDHADGDTFYGYGGNDTIKALGGNDFIFAGDGNDKIYAAGGNDIIWAGLGNDYIDGGAGVDSVAYTDGPAGGVTVDLAITTAQNTGIYGVDTLINVENIVGGTGNNVLRGNAVANVLSGQGGNDLIDGRAGNDEINGNNGADTLLGGTGNDKFTTEGNDSASDFVDGGAGIDVIDYTFLNLVVGAAGVNVDLRLTGAQDTGAAGVDTIVNVENLIGGIRNDVLNGSDGANNINGGAGNDVISGNGGNDIVNGFTGSDIVVGGAGDDVVDGGMTGSMGEMDMLYGGAGADRFFFASVGSSWTGSNDQIMDFSAVEGDKIDIHGVFLNGGAVVIGLTPTFIGAAAFSGVAGQLQVKTTFDPSTSLVNVDWDGNGAADFTLAVTSDAPLTLADFIL